MKKIIFFIILFCMLSTANAQSNITGEYYLKGVMETASGFLLKSDSTFEFFFSYGALDRFGSGRWTLAGDKIIFNSKQKPGQDFTLISSKKVNNDFTTIKIIDSRTYLLDHVYGALQYADTSLGEISNQEGEIKIAGKNAEKVSLTFEFCPEKTFVLPIDKNLNYFEFKFEPWIAEVFFTDFQLTLTGNELTGKHPLLEEKDYHFVKEK